MNALRKLPLGRLGPGLSRYSDIALAALVVGIVAMMIIPLPTFLLDILITTNISLSVILLLVCIYVSKPLRIAALPSILLITTLFRLGLNVSSTRLILLQADAGEVIASFGKFVVAGNLVVGAVIFLILTIIQFIVIAKGSERVAEVAARFTLDAMPGKQMSIDADVRAGAIDLDEARRQRAQLQRESQLYGAMDGAMKFVKGDAIAGILIIIINIVGGLVIGVWQRQMQASDALLVYSILTIGDGLVSQIPALLISTAAGIVVTRVASEEEEGHLGQDIGQQVLAQPKAIAIAAGLLALLAFIPGMPTIPFLLLAIFTGALSYALIKSSKEAAAEKGAAAKARLSEKELPVAATLEEMPAMAQISLEVSESLTTFIDAQHDAGIFMRELIPGLRELIYTEYGVVLPGVHVRGRSAALAPHTYRIFLAEVPMAEGQVPPNALIALANNEHLQAEGITSGQPIVVPGLAESATQVPLQFAENLARANIPTLDPPTQMLLHLGQVLRTYAYEFIGIQETQSLLDGLERTSPSLVHEVIPKIVTVHTLTEVLRRLVEEGISIRNLRDILQSLAEWGHTEKDPLILAEYVRIALKRYISFKYAQEPGTLRVYLLDPAIEEAVRDAIHQTDKGRYLALEPEISRQIIEAVGKQVTQFPTDEPLPVVLTQMDVRRYVRRLLEIDFPQLSVLSFTELLPELQIQPVARVSVS